MQVVFTVAGVTNASKNVTTEVNGELIRATIPALQVEFTSDHFGSLTLQFVGSERDAATALFKAGSAHTWTIA